MQARLSLLSLDDGTISATNDGDEAPESPFDAMPERIGRYLVLAKLGEGAMGVVHSAYDPDLDRKLALKLLHEEGQRDNRTLRLLREAQALARVSHPNVIQVYDVGTFEDRVYIAMEFVDGVSLGAWRSAEQRSPEQILAVFCKAGHGLAAAHDKGLVHRDFKPDNVLVARPTQAGSGTPRVVVLDFGIAHAVGTAEPLDQNDDAVRQRVVEHSMTHGPIALLGGNLTGTSRAFDTEITRAGALIGTPAYMAPEQLEGRPTDERSDQFSFCVALWEALHGERPFAGESPLALWQAMRDDAIRPPKNPAVRKHIHRALLRGLAINPERRFPSMAALLAVLEHDPAARRRRLALALTAVGALGLALWSLASRPAPAPLCEEQRFASSWNPDRRAAIERAFGRVESPLAGHSLSTVFDGLDRYAAQWQTMYVDACRATRVRGEQSEELLDRRMVCLEDRRLGFDALVDVLLEPDATVIENAATAVAALRPIDTCANHRALTARVAPPEDPALAERVEVIGRELSLARARRDAGDHQRALTIAREAESRAAATVYAPIQAAALIEVGLTANEAGDYAEAEAKLREGFYQALAADDEQACVEASTALVQVTGDHQQDFNAAANWTRIADALLDRRSDQRSRARVELEFFSGIVHWRQGELERAHTELEAALALAQALGESETLLQARVRKGLGSTLWSLGKADEAAGEFELVVETLARELGDQHPKVGSALNNLASAHYSLGRLDLAEAELSRALRIYEVSYGDEHPSVANSLNNLAVISSKLGKLEQARDIQLRVIGIYERTVGPEHPELANVWSNLGRVLRMLEDYEEAAEYYRRAYERRVEALGAEHSDTMTSLGGLALTQFDLGQRDEGFANFEIVLATQRRLLGDDHTTVAEVELQFGAALVEHGRAREGEALVRRSLATRERVLAPDHLDIAESLAALGHALVLRGGYSEALQLLDRFKAMEEAAKATVTTRARVRLDIARALVALRDHAGARAAAKEGLAMLEGAEGPANKRLRRSLNEWLSAHP